MLERILAKSTWVMGLIVILCTYNMAYANVKVNDNIGSVPASERTGKLNDDSTAKASTTDTTSATVPLNKLNASTIRKTATAANSCSCSCTARTGRAAAAAPGAWWDCVKGCLRSWGVSVVQITLCGVACAGGVIPLCAACLAIDISLVMLCSIGCEVYTGPIPGQGHDHVPILVKKTPLKNKAGTERSAMAFSALK